MDESVNFHPIELAAHFLLSPSLDNVHESFSSLHQSQRILLARLKLIEDRLEALRTESAKSDVDVSQAYARIKSVRKKLANCTATLGKINAKVAHLES